MKTETRLQFQKIYDNLGDNDENSSKVIGIHAIMPNLFVATITFDDVQLRPASPLIIDHITICGISEFSTTSLYTVSTFRVFQLITVHANEMSLHYKRGLEMCSPDSALKKILRWVNWYNTLYVEPCRHCKKILINDSEALGFLPPTLRLPPQGAAFHPRCATKESSRSDRRN